MWFFVFNNLIKGCDDSTWLPACREPEWLADPKKKEKSRIVDSWQVYQSINFLVNTKYAFALGGISFATCFWTITNWAYSELGLAIVVLAFLRPGNRDSRYFADLNWVERNSCIPWDDRRWDQWGSWRAASWWRNQWWCGSGASEKTYYVAWKKRTGFINLRRLNLGHKTQTKILKAYANKNEELFLPEHLGKQNFTLKLTFSCKEQRDAVISKN